MRRFISVYVYIDMTDSLHRVSIWKHTVEFCKQNQLSPGPSVKHTQSPLSLGHSKTSRFTNTRIRVLNYDCLECALRLKALRPAVLNLADNSFPGGAVDVGSGAQEESIFRRTDIHRSLNLQTGFYPLRNVDTVYTPNVHVIKNRDGTFKDVVQCVSVISAPALRMPSLVDGELTRKDAELLKQKIRMVLDTALYYNHSAIILGAMGCGAWRNPAVDVAKCFQEVLKEYQGMFHTVVFAVLQVPTSEYLIRDRTRKRTNYEIFKEVIGGT